MKATLVPWEARCLFPFRRTALWATLALLGSGWVAAIERAQELAGAADRSLAFVLGIVLPLLALGAVLHLAGGAPLRDLGAAAARYGAARRAGVMKALLGVTAGLGGIASLLSWVAVLGARGLEDPHLRADLAATTPVALATAAAYTFWMAAGACFGARGAGILCALLADWLLGATALPLALVTPRFHARYLLGLEAAFTFPPWQSFAWLVGLALCSAGVVALRVPR